MEWSNHPEGRITDQWPISVEQWNPLPKEQNCELIKKCFPSYRRESMNVYLKGFQDVTANGYRAYFPFLHFPSWSFIVVILSLPPLYNRCMGSTYLVLGLQNVNDPILIPYMKVTSMWNKYPNFKNNSIYIEISIFFVQNSQINKNLTSDVLNGTFWG